MLECRHSNIHVDGRGLYPTLWLLRSGEGHTWSLRCQGTRKYSNRDCRTRCTPRSHHNREPNDLDDGGAAHFASTVRWIRKLSPTTRVELLISDLMGSQDAVHTILEAGAHIVAHNTETVPRLYRRGKPKSDYRRTVNVLKWIHEWPDVVSKTGIMLGLGETDEEIESVMHDLREVGCEILSLGQYLSPSTRHMGVDRWVHQIHLRTLQARSATSSSRGGWTARPLGYMAQDPSSTAIIGQDNDRPHAILRPRRNIDALKPNFLSGHSGWLPVVSLLSHMR